MTGANSFYITFTISVTVCNKLKRSGNLWHRFAIGRHKEDQIRKLPAEAELKLQK